MISFVRQSAFVAFCSLLLALFFSSCADQPTSPGLINTSELGTRRGYSFARVQTHFHSPYSFDACDSKGLVNGVINLECLRHIKSALCTNHIDVTFVTDHSNHMAEFTFADLALVETGDSAVLNGSSETIGNRLGCSDGFAAYLSPGLEGKLLALGMERHVTGDLATRQSVYGGESSTEVSTLETQSSALVGVPHTESRDLTLIRSLQPVITQPLFIEIYNVHANIDPKIRKRSLGLPPFEHIAKFLNYLVDPYKDLNPDFFFVEFYQLSSLYFTKWNTLLSEGRSLWGFAGLDSHENVFAQKAADGERLDSHRRMTRFMSNLVLTSARDIPGVKTALTAGRSYFVLEGLGTPSGLDFYGTDNGTVVEMGGTANIGVGETSSIVAQIPSVHSSSLFMDYDDGPIIQGEIHYIDSSGNESIVAKGSSGTLTVTDPAAGHYRFHAVMIPRQLLEVIFSKRYAFQAHTWIVSNPVRVIR